MSNELDKRRGTALQSMVDVEFLPAMPDLDLAMNHAARIPLANLSALGVAFQPLTTAIQTAVTGGGGSGLYYVGTKGMQMFSTSEGFIGSLKTAFGTVGGCQARMTALACDPTMLFSVFIEFMLSAIQEALMEAVKTGSTENMSTEEQRWYQIERFLKKNGTISNADVRKMLGVSAATANRILARFVEEGKIQKIRIGKSWGYIVR